MLHLDTSTVVAHLRGDKQVGKKIQENLDQIAIDSLVLAELLYGAGISARATENLAQVRGFRSLVQLVAFDERAAEGYGELRAKLRREGKQTGETDALIASVALARGATLVTHNVRHFENIEGLSIEDWVAG